MQTLKTGVKNRLRTPEGMNGWGRSQTIPGQSLIPAELLERHLAGTLPDLDQADKFEFHYDEEGNEIGQPMPLDYIELETLAAAYRAKQREAAIEFRKQEAKELRDKIIADYQAEQAALRPSAEPKLENPDKGASA